MKSARKLKIAAALLLCLSCIMAFSACKTIEGNQSSGGGGGGDDLSPDFALVEEYTDDPINDKAYERKLKIEEMFKCVLKQVSEPSRDDVVARYQKSILSEDGAYDFAITTCANFSSLLTGNYLADLSDMINFGNIILVSGGAMSITPSLQVVSEIEKAKNGWQKAIDDIVTAIESR